MLGGRRRACAELLQSPSALGSLLHPQALRPTMASVRSDQALVLMDPWPSQEARGLGTSAQSRRHGAEGGSGCDLVPLGQGGKVLACPHGGMKPPLWGRQPGRAAAAGSSPAQGGNVLELLVPALCSALMPQAERWGRQAARGAHLGPGVDLRWPAPREVCPAPASSPHRHMGPYPGTAVGNTVD